MHPRGDIYKSPTDEGTHCERYAVCAYMGRIARLYMEGKPRVSGLSVGGQNVKGAPVTAAWGSVMSGYL